MATSFSDRLIRTAQLDSAVYEEIEADRSATMQAATVVVVASVAAALGAGLRVGLLGFIVVALLALAGWSLYAWIVYFLGTTVLKETKADWGEVARTVGFAYAPEILLIFHALGILGVLIGAAAHIWFVVTTVVAVRASLDVGTGRAVVIAIIASFVQLLLQGFFLGLQGL